MPGVTKEQIRQAREADLFAYLERHERGVLKRDGPNYRHKEHDSLVYVTAKNYWYWNSRGKRINALDYLMEIRGYGLVDAVNALAGPAMQYSFPSRPHQNDAAARQVKKPDRCYLPWQKKCATSYVSYLQKRGISTAVIKHCTQLGILYEGSYKKKEPDGKATYIPVCVFVGKDEHGTAKFACMRGIHSDLRKDAYGSDKEYSFCLPPHQAGSRHVAVFEAPIDALSHATLQEMDGWKWDGYYEAPTNEQNFATLVEMLNAMEVREDDESFKNAVDLLFDALEQKDPDHFALRQYKKFKLAAGKTAKSILISCASRLAPFDIKEVREITMYDELDLDMLGDERTALFLIMSDTDGTFAFLISLIYSILFNRLCERADDVYGGRLPIHVRCLIDEAANIGQIPNLERLMATIRSREISACLVLQAQSQLKALYKDNMDTIIGNCDASLFLGGKEETTLKSWNSLLGKETIDLYNTSVTKGTQESHGQNFQKLGKDLMSMDEIAVMDGGKCLLQIRGVRPFLSRKYDITKHPNYKYLSDHNPKNAFDIEKFLSTRLPLYPGEAYRSYEISPEEFTENTA